MAWVSRRFPQLCPYYRLAYNTFAVLSAIPLLLCKQALAGEALFTWSGPWALARWGLLLGAAWLFWAGAREYDLDWFGGLAQLRSRCTFAGNPDAMPLRTSGILGRVRHPWYGGAIMLLWTHTAGFDAANLATSLTLTGYVFVGAWLEERKLLHVHGEAYQDYQRRVPMFFPRPWGGRG
jgi:protein-S-isoprenylcysteine O-methyltransferase Ste14